MAAPYAPGQTIAWLSPDPDGIRVARTTVHSVEHAGDTASWLITTDHGAATVDHSGVGAAALPIDADIDIELYLHGDNYLVRPSVTELERSLDQDSGQDLDDDLGLD